MTDYYTCLRKILAEYCSSVLCADILPELFFLAPHGYAARCAAPLRLELKHDASFRADALRAQMDRPHLFGARLIGEITHSQGHILFHFTDKFYTAAVAHILLETPKTTPLPPYDSNRHPNACSTRECALLETAAYTQRRMWMLSRETERTEPLCPAYENVQRALLLCMGLTEKGIGRRAAFRRLEITCDALLTLSHGLVPKDRPLFLRRCAHVGDAASRLLMHWHAQWHSI
jgi:hypothetical protein